MILDRGLKILNRIGPYGLAAAVQAGTSFVVLPLLLLLIGPDAYGKFALLEPLSPLLGQVLLLGAHQGLLHAICRDGANPIRVMNKTLYGVHLYLVPLLLATYWLTYLWKNTYVIATMFTLAVYLEALNLICLTTVRAMSHAWSYFAATAARTLTLLIGVATANLFTDQSELDEKFPLALMILSAFFSLITLAVRAIKSSLDNVPTEQEAVFTYDLTGSIRYGFPIVLASLCQSGIALADRYVLGAFVSPATLAGYVVSLKLANALNLAATPINLWWPTARFEHARDLDQGRVFFRISAVRIGALYSVLACMLILLSPWILKLLGPGVNSNTAIASLLVVAAMLQAFQVILNVGLLSAGHTKKIFYIAASVAVFHIFGCLLLVPRFGDYGAAVMALGSALLFTFCINYASQKVVRVSQNFGMLGTQFVTVGICAILMAVSWTLKN